MKRECHMVEDLLPLYLEDMLSQESAAFVEEHLRKCEACRLEYENMKKEGTFVQKQENEAGMDIRPFRSLMKKINRQTSMLSYGLIILFVFFGFSLTEGADVMYNSLIMPIVGVFGYIAFRRSALIKMPILLLVIDLAAYALGMVEMDFGSVFFWTLLYGGFVLAGIAIAWLLHFAFGKENEDET